MADKIKVYFLGAGMIAVPVLETLFNSSEVELVGIGTQPDRPAGRKKQLVPAPVGAWANEKGIEIDKPTSVNAPDYLDRLRSLQPDIILVISFGQLLKQEILELPEVSCVNIHASLLPKYRGASPIAAALLFQEEVTGITFMQMDRGLDTGPEYCMFKHVINETERADELEMNLGKIGADNVIDVLHKIADGSLQPIPQNDEASTYTGKIRKSDGKIDWSQSAVEIIAKMRAFHPWPGISCIVERPKGNVNVRIEDADIVDASGKPGEVITADKKEWIVACGEQAIRLSRVVPQGKKVMGGADFLRGCQIEVGTVLPTPVSN